MKRTPISVDPALIEEVVRLSGVKTRSEAVELALKEAIRRRKLERLASRAGTVELGMTQEELRSWRMER